MVACFSAEPGAVQEHDEAVRVVHSLRPVRDFRGLLACVACALVRAREPSSRCDVEWPMDILLSPQTLLASRALMCIEMFSQTAHSCSLTAARARSQELAGPCMLQEEALRRRDGDGLD